MDVLSYEYILIAVFMNSLYRIAACKHYRTKFYFGMKCLNKVIISIITSTRLTTSWYFIAPVRAVHFTVAVSHSHDALAVTALELFLLAFCKEHHGKFTWRDTLLVISIEVVLNEKSNPILYYIEPRLLGCTELECRTDIDNTK